jgi:hypothetical protein
MLWKQKKSDLLFRSEIEPRLVVHQSRTVTTLNSQNSVCRTSGAGVCMSNILGTEAAVKATGDWNISASISGSL